MGGGGSGGCSSFHQNDTDRAGASLRMVPEQRDQPSRFDGPGGLGEKGRQERIRDYAAAGFSMCRGKGLSVGGGPIDQFGSW